MNPVPCKRTLARLACLLLALAAVTAAPADAQERSRWTFTAIFGTTDRGPGDDVHASFLERNFEPDEDCIGLSCPGKMTETGFGASGYPFLVEFRYAVVPWAGVGVLGGLTEIGRTVGIDSQSRYLRVRYEADIVAPIVWISAMDVVRVGAGPAYYTARMTREDQGRPSEDQRKFVWAPVFEGNLSLPVRGPVRFEARAQYRPIGELEYGPYYAGQFLPNSAVVFAPAVADFTHWFFGAGVSVEL